MELLKNTFSINYVKSVQIRTRNNAYLDTFHVFSPNIGKYGPEITPYLDTFYAVKYFRIFDKISNGASTFDYANSKVCPVTYMVRNAEFPLALFYLPKIVIISWYLKILLALRKICNFVSQNSS